MTTTALSANHSQTAPHKKPQFTRKKIEEFSYGLNDVIGKGYSSQVYRGRHDDTEEEVAVKVIDMKMLKNEINRTLLESEIEILKQLRHTDNVLTLHDVYTTKNNTYIITELCSSDLNKKIKPSSTTVCKLSHREAFRYMDQILEGYTEIYNREIVHRDLKPANILLSSKDEAKIADFGFAIKAQELLKPSKYNVGSPLYMAPESLKRNEYSYKTDLWSIGVIFYEMLTGETPWKAKTEKELIKKIESESIEVLLHKSKCEAFSPQTREFLSRCLCIDKNKRLEPFDLNNYRFSAGSKTEKASKTAILRNEAFSLNNVLMETKSLNQSIKPPICGNQIGENGLKNINTSFSNNSMFTSPKNQLLLGNKNFQFPSQTDTRTQGKGRHFGDKVENTNTDSLGTGNALNTTLNLNKTLVDPTKGLTSRPQGELGDQKVQNGVPSLEKDTLKSMSKQLISEIHFCRYLFKLLARIKQSNGGGGLLARLKSSKLASIETANSCLKAVTRQYTQIIRFKIENLISFQKLNFLRVDDQTYEQYKLSTDFKKIIKISKEYKERYQEELKDDWSHDGWEELFESSSLATKSSGANSAKELKAVYKKRLYSAENTLQFMKMMIGLFEESFNLIDGPQKSQNASRPSTSKLDALLRKYSKDVVILDYMITSKQLLEMLGGCEGQNYEKFARKSKIEEIVEGSTMQITEDLYTKIRQRAKELVQHLEGVSEEGRQGTFPTETALMSANEHARSQQYTSASRNPPKVPKVVSMRN